MRGPASAPSLLLVLPLLVLLSQFPRAAGGECRALHDLALSQVAKLNLTWSEGAAPPLEPTGDRRMLACIRNNELWFKFQWRTVIYLDIPERVFGSLMVIYQLLAHGHSLPDTCFVMAAVNDDHDPRTTYQTPQHEEVPVLMFFEVAEQLLRENTFLWPEADMEGFMTYHTLPEKLHRARAARELRAWSLRKDQVYASGARQQGREELFACMDDPGFAGDFDIRQVKWDEMDLRRELPGHVSEWNFAHYKYNLFMPGSLDWSSNFQRICRMGSTVIAQAGLKSFSLFTHMVLNQCPNCTLRYQHGEGVAYSTGPCDQLSKELRESRLRGDGERVAERLQRFMQEEMSYECVHEYMAHVLGSFQWPAPLPSNMTAHGFTLFDCQYQPLFFKKYFKQKTLAYVFRNYRKWFDFDCRHRGDPLENDQLHPTTLQWMTDHWGEDYDPISN